jgi:hypothetical protein
MPVADVHAKDVLFDNRFAIHPDESHLSKNNTTNRDTGLFAGIDNMQENPDYVAVLFGDSDRPYMRADPYFMSVSPGDQEAQDALDVLVKGMDEIMFDFRLEAGDFCFLDNFRVVHGRKPFTARHDGTDRWLKRINIACDLRKSRDGLKAGSRRAIA